MSRAETAQNLRKFHSSAIDNMFEQWYNGSALTITQQRLNIRPDFSVSYRTGP